MGLSPRLYFPPLIHFVFLFGLKFLLLVAQNWWMNPFFMSVIFILFLFLSLWSFDTKFNALLSMSYQEHVKAHLPVDVSCDCEGIFWIYVSNKHSFGPLLVLGWMFYLAQIRGACYWILLQDMEYYNKLEEPYWWGKRHVGSGLWAYRNVGSFFMNFAMRIFHYLQSLFFPF